MWNSTSKKDIFFEVVKRKTTFWALSIIKLQFISSNTLSIYELCRFFSCQLPWNTLYPLTYDPIPDCLSRGWMAVKWDRGADGGQHLFVLRGWWMRWTWKDMVCVKRQGQKQQKRLSSDFLKFVGRYYMNSKNFQKLFCCTVRHNFYIFI